MRLFYAFPLSDGEKKHIGECLAPGKELYPALKWVKPENMHLTLHFLGEVPLEKVEKFRQLLNHPDMEQESFSVGYEGFGRFPAKGIPRVFFINLVSGIGECRRIHVKLAGLLRPIFRVAAKPFVPHITAARVKGKMAVYPDVRQLSCPMGSISIGRIVLFESVLKPEGAVYREVARRELM